MLAVALLVISGALWLHGLFGRRGHPLEWILGSLLLGAALTVG